MAIPTPSTGLDWSHPSSWLLSFGVLLEGGDVATFSASAGLSPTTTTGIALFGGFLVGLGALLHKAGH